MRAVLDACVLYPTVLREILLGLALRGLYEPIFSDRILAEWTRAAHKLGPGATAIAEGEAALLRARLPRALHRAEPALQSRLYLPDPDDIHVLAIAIGAHADAIITLNAQDFPRPILSDHGLIRLDPDQFITNLLPRHLPEVRAATQEVLATARRLSGEEIPLGRLLRKARLNRLARLLEADAAG